MADKFVETKKIVNSVINGNGPGCAYMSVVPNGASIDLVIGANYNNKCASAFNRATLGELINTLKEIHEVMLD